MDVATKLILLLLPIECYQSESSYLIRNADSIHEAVHGRSINEVATKRINHQIHHSPFLILANSMIIVSAPAYTNWR
jgi:hypothetical protein